VIREAKRRDNGNYILHAKNKSKAIWSVIHKETGKTLSQKQDIIIVKTSVEVTNSSEVAELLNSNFYEISNELLKEEGEKHQPRGTII
jgi:hypothetical protein